MRSIHVQLRPEIKTKKKDAMLQKRDRSAISDPSQTWPGSDDELYWTGLYAQVFLCLSVVLIGRF